MSSRKAFEIGGLIAAVVLIAFGIAAVVMGFGGRSTVTDNLKQQKIVGTPDMTPAAITGEAKKAGLNPSSLPIPSCSVAGKTVNSGSSARCFAQYMQMHTLFATGGKFYAEMPRYATADGKGTNDPKAAVTKGGQPVDNPARNIWINETALTTSLNASYMADQTALFGVVVGIALLLSGIGFAVLAIGGALRNPDSVLRSVRKRETTGSSPAAAAGA